jgi:hypothetical protein
VGLLWGTGCVDASLGAEAGTPKSELGVREAGAGDSLLPPIELSGTVRSPNGSLPIFGALVYGTGQAPKDIPQTVYCDKCVELAPSTPHTTSAADGKFTLKLPYGGKWLIVTQKGAFRRARWVTVTQSGPLADEVTTLPAKTDASNGDFIPKMAVIQGSWDAIERSLAKLGLGKVDANGSLVKESESFSLYKCDVTSVIPPAVDCKPKHPSVLLQDYAEISQYHIVFVPCTSDWLDSSFSDPEVKKNLLRWITAGGRLYVTDWSYDLLTQILPGYITWEGESSTMGSAEMPHSYDAPAIVDNADLKSWLDVQGFTTFDLLASWTVIKTLAKLPTPGPDGDPTLFDISPTAWMSGHVPDYGIRPMTVRFPYGCGRVLFSSYHTEGAGPTGSTLLPQESALLYMILELAVCLKNPTVD